MSTVPSAAKRRRPLTLLMAVMFSVLALSALTSACVAPIPTFTPPSEGKPPKEYFLTDLYLTPLGKDGQACGGGKVLVNVCVFDYRTLSPLPDVPIYEALVNGKVNVYRTSETGCVQIATGRETCGKYFVASEELSEETPLIGNACPPFELIWDAGYCSCLGEGITEEKCRREHEKGVFWGGHYEFNVVFAYYPLIPRTPSTRQPSR